MLEMPRNALETPLRRSSSEDSFSSPSRRTPVSLPPGNTKEGLLNIPPTPFPMFFDRARWPMFKSTRARLMNEYIKTLDRYPMEFGFAMLNVLLKGTRPFIFLDHYGIEGLSKILNFAAEGLETFGNRQKISEYLQTSIFNKDLLSTGCIFDQFFTWNNDFSCPFILKNDIIAKFMIRAADLAYPNGNVYPFLSKAFKSGKNDSMLYSLIDSCQDCLGKQNKKAIKVLDVKDENGDYPLEMLAREMIKLNNRLKLLNTSDKDYNSVKRAKDRVILNIGRFIDIGINKIENKQLMADLITSCLDTFDSNTFEKLMKVPDIEACLFQRTSRLRGNRNPGFNSSSPFTTPFEEIAIAFRRERYSGDIISNMGEVLPFVKFIYKCGYVRHFSEGKNSQYWERKNVPFRKEGRDIAKIFNDQILGFFRGYALNLAKNEGKTRFNIGIIPGPTPPSIPN